MKPPLVLYHYWSSTCSQKARFGLAEKGPAWESHHVDLFKFQHWEPDYIRLNPNGMVPTLVHGETVVTDSNIILEYIEDRFDGPALRPAAADQAARMRSWMKEADAAQGAAIKASYNLRYKKRIAHYDKATLIEIGKRNPNPEFRRSWLRKIEDGVSAEEEEAAYARLERLVEKMDRQLARTAWLAGDDFSLADIALAPYVNRIEVLSRPEMLAPEVHPHLAEWWARLQARPGYREAFSFQNPDPDDPIKR